MLKQQKQLKKLLLFGGAFGIGSAARFPNPTLNLPWIEPRPTLGFESSWCLNNKSS
ncbi:hypothetical protein [Sphingobacterium paludis]|uniref:hypothetical protein n=1 Tax=Sphingobacterium paludis TaxID=1476465 RepID=UPI00141505B8|nr:hypothetical protein [Sphingobacterium paludis]